VENIGGFGKLKIIGLDQDFLKEKPLNQINENKKCKKRGGWVRTIYLV